MHNLCPHAMSGWYNSDLSLFIGVRDYIHVMDLAEGHLAAVNKLDEKPGLKVRTVNLG